MTKLNQIVAVEKGVMQNTSRALTDAYHAIQSNPRLSGIARTYQPKDEEGETLPSEKQHVQVSANTVIEAVKTDLTRLFDVTLTKDITNCSARADVVVDGVTLVRQAPVSYLLFLEKQLVDLGTFISKLPTLDPAEHWTYDETAGAYRSDEIQTTRTKKVPRNHVLAEATDKHPAQVQMYHEDIIVGTWKTTKFSGALPAQEIEDMKKRLVKLQEAVKFAREEANTTEVVDQFAGDEVLSYLFG